MPQSTETVGEVRTDALLLRVLATRTEYLLEGVLRKSCRHADGAYHDEHLHARLSA